MKLLEVGDSVLLTLRTPGPVGITEGMRKYQDRQFEVSKVKTITQRGQFLTYYELKGCVSEYGIPYAVTYDMLMPIREYGVSQKRRRK